MVNYVTDDFLRELPRHASTIVFYSTGERYNDVMIEFEVMDNRLVCVNVNYGEDSRAIYFSPSAFHTYDNTGRFIFIFSDSNKVTLAIIKEK